MSQLRAVRIDWITAVDAQAVSEIACRLETSNIHERLSADHGSMASPMLGLSSPFHGPQPTTKFGRSDLPPRTQLKHSSTRYRCEAGGRGTTSRGSEDVNKSCDLTASSWQSPQPRAFRMSSHKPPCVEQGRFARPTSPSISVSYSYSETTLNMKDFILKAHCLHLLSRFPLLPQPVCSSASKLTWTYQLFNSQHMRRGKALMTMSASRTLAISTLCVSP